MRWGGVAATKRNDGEWIDLAGETRYTEIMLDRSGADQSGMISL